MATPISTAPEGPLRQLEGVLRETIPPMIVQARETFRRDLPRLLAAHPREWVAYSGEQCLGLSPTKTGLYQECLRRGFTPGQFLVLRVEAERPREIEVPLDV